MIHSSRITLALAILLSFSTLAVAQEIDEPAMQTASAMGESMSTPASPGIFMTKEVRVKRRKEEAEDLNKHFEWWPTDAKPGAVRDEETGGYWWYPTTPGKVRPWGNRGYIYVFKIIFDYKADELPPAKPNELRPSLLVRRIIKNVKVYFDYNKAGLRADAKVILDDGLRILRKNNDASVLVTGNADVRGTEGYNMKLAKRRGEAVKNYFTGNGVDPERIRVVSRGKLDATAPVTDLVGMQKDRNAQFMIAEVQEVMLPYQGPPQGVDAIQVDDDTYVMEEKQTIESTIQVSTREYTVQKRDTLSKIARKELGGAHRWVYLYNLNKDRIKNPDKLKPGDKILIPVE